MSFKSTLNCLLHFKCINKPTQNSISVYIIPNRALKKKKNGEGSESFPKLTQSQIHSSRFNQNYAVPNGKSQPMTFSFAFTKQHDHCPEGKQQ